MLFNTYSFLFLFFPATVAVYFILNRCKYTRAAQWWLTLSSLVFYGWWNIKYIPLIIASITFNYAMGRWLAKLADTKAVSMRRRKWALIAGLSANLLLLGYYKYAGFFLENLHELTGHTFPFIQVVLPLGISFFTFTQIAYLVDVHRGKAHAYHYVDYMLFVTFYPHLIAGPILHHGEMMPQFERLKNKLWNWHNAAQGAYMLCLGLFKKVVIADTFASYADSGFASAVHFTDTWIAALSYTFQLYFDFSGYTDMAIGIALVFNIKLPQNFNSPYKALTIQDFWRRWHMTLSRFLRDYIYIPLGGNRKGFWMAIRNTIITFVLGGLWHGAGWTFILWGLLHGVGQGVQRVWSVKVGWKLPKWLAWSITFGFINVTWVFFRSEDVGQAIHLLKGMAGLNGWGWSAIRSHLAPILLILISLFVIIGAYNSSERLARFRPSGRTALMMGVMLVVSLLFLNRITTFLYFNF
ncbi:membrane-bound O-acyltransferase family protein [Paenibacillus selenitireducens]|uniref:Membrane-bound O-acyltransferase family protein n=1 Tax=Paenibacillus selenitireducens TaxID=1324314 RepID=A0A1T2XGU4_9BACL|nr:MBOAT family protein [Paenibacillus selenitireducens]OPA79032.1 membrane-bound O-acyltransferase family protein [Paenibacillus selenitireducens]